MMGTSGLEARRCLAGVGGRREYGSRWYESEGSETGSICTGVSRFCVFLGLNFQKLHCGLLGRSHWHAGSMYACSQSGPRLCPSARASRDAAPSETLLFTLAHTRAASMPRGADRHWQNASLILLFVWQIQPPVAHMAMAILMIMYMLAR